MDPFHLSEVVAADDFASVCLLLEVGLTNAKENYIIHCLLHSLQILTTSIHSAILIILFGVLIVLISALITLTT